MNDREVLRELAKQWLELARSPVMSERKNIWRAVNKGRQIRPAVLVETCLMTDYVLPSELKCTDEFNRQTEKYMLECIRHASEIGDDFVLEPYLRMPWSVSTTHYGMDISEKHAVDSEGDEVATTYEHPIKTPSDVMLLKSSEYAVDREGSISRLNMQQELFGDILPVLLEGTDPVYGAGGYSPFAGLYITEVTLDLYKLIGMYNIYYWLYDSPELIHTVMRAVTDNFINYHRFLEREGLLSANSDNSLTGGRYGYESEGSAQRPPKLSDLWLWCNAEETTSISPEMYEEFIIPYISEAAALFGKIYFGCCENIDSRWDIIRDNVKNIRAVSISPFSDLDKMGENLGGKYIFSRKPHPAYLSTPTPDWDSAGADLRHTLNAAKDCTLELIMRDVYRVRQDRRRLSEWVDLAKSMM